MWHEDVSMMDSGYEHYDAWAADVLNQNTSALVVLLVALALMTVLFLLDNFRNSVQDVRHISRTHHMMQKSAEFEDEDIISQIAAEVTPAGKIILAVSYLGMGKIFMYTSLLLFLILSYAYYLLRLDILFPERQKHKGRKRGSSFGDADVNSL